MLMSLQQISHSVLLFCLVMDVLVEISPVVVISCFVFHILLHLKERTKLLAGCSLDQPFQFNIYKYSFRTDPLAHAVEHT